MTFSSLLLCFSLWNFCLFETTQFSRRTWPGCHLNYVIRVVVKTKRFATNSDSLPTSINAKASSKLINFMSNFGLYLLTFFKQLSKTYQILDRTLLWASFLVESCPVFVKFSFTYSTVVVATVRVGDAGTAFLTTWQRTAWPCSLRTEPSSWDALSTFKRVAPNVFFTKPVRVWGANDTSCPNEVMGTGTKCKAPWTDSVIRSSTRVTERYWF